MMLVCPLHVCFRSPGVLDVFDFPSVQLGASRYNHLLIFLRLPLFQTCCITWVRCDVNHGFEGRRLRFGDYRLQLSPELFVKQQIMEICGGVSRQLTSCYWEASVSLSWLVISHLYRLTAPVKSVPFTAHFEQTFFHMVASFPSVKNEALDWFYYTSLAGVVSKHIICRSV